MRRVGEGDVERLQKPEKGLDYHSTTVRSEEMLQETLLTVSELQHLSKDFWRGTFTKKQLSMVIKKMLKIYE